MLVSSLLALDVRPSCWISVDEAVWHQERRIADPVTTCDMFDLMPIGYRGR